MHPEFTLFGLTLKAYSLFAVLAAVVGAVLVWPALRREGLSRPRAAALLLGMCTAFLVGARLWNVAVNPSNFGHGLYWYSLRMAGMSLYGGILGAFLVLLAALRLRRRNVWRVLDGFVTPSGAAFCLSRVGCFLNGCCKGIRTDSFLGVVFPQKGAPLQLGPLRLFTAPQAVHPTQLYELALAALGLPLCVLLAKRLRLREGGLFLLYGVWFCLMRLAVLPLRSLSYPAAIRSVVYPLLYLGLAALGICLLLRRREKPSAP